MDFDPKAEVNTTALAAVLGVTGRRIQQLAQDGIISAEDKGKYILSDAVQRYVDFRVREKVMTKIEQEMQESESQLKKAKAIKAVLETKELQGKMHRADDVALITQDWFFAVRGMMIALPGRLAIDVANLSDPNEVSERIRQEVYLVMEEMANYQYDRKKFEELVRERLSWDKIDVEDGADDDG